ncbi:MAG: hypothetical protein MO852_02540 [Candidatus Devosia euplotis]|nr:hypothetical protein [Candidatus Devosia euplotis]
MLIAFRLTDSGGESVPPLSHILGYCTGGSLLLAGFVWWEGRARHPMLPLRLFAIVPFAGANVLTFTLYFALTRVTFYLPMTMIAGWGASAAQVSLVMLPFGAALTLISGLSGQWADRFGPGPLITLGAVLAVLPLIALAGMGMALVVSPLSTAVITAVDDSDTGIASGINNAVSRVAGLVAVAAMGMLAALVFEQSLGSAAELPVFFGLPASGLTASQEALRQAATNSAFGAIAYFNAGLCFVSGLVVWVTLERKL